MKLHLVLASLLISHVWCNKYITIVLHIFDLGAAARPRVCAAVILLSPLVFVPTY